MSSWQALNIIGNVVQVGFQTLLFFSQPQQSGDGKIGWFESSSPHTYEP